MNIFIDTNILYAKGLQEDNYLILNKYQDKNAIKVYIHEYSILELRNHVLVDVLKITKSYEDNKKKLDKYIYIFPEIRHDMDCAALRCEIEKSIRQFFDRQKFIVIEQNHTHLKSVCDDYFSISNAFDHAIGDKEAKNRKRGNFIDAILAYGYLGMAESSKKNVLITKNNKDFAWLKNQKIELINDINDVYENYKHELGEQIDDERIANIFQQIEIKDVSSSIKDKIINALSDHEYIPISSANYPCNVNDQNEVTILTMTFIPEEKQKINFHDNINLNPLTIIKNGDDSELSYRFMIKTKADVSYVASISCLLDHNFINVNSRGEFKSAFGNHSLQVDDYSGIGEGICEVSYKSDIIIYGVYSVTYKDNANPQDILNALSTNSKVSFIFDESYSTPRHE